MLTDNDRTLFTRLKIVWEKQDTVGENTVPHIKDDLITFPAGFIINEPCSRIRRHIGGWTPADDFVPEIGFSIRTRLLPFCERRGIGFFPKKMLPPRCRFPQETLRQIHQLCKLPLLPRLVIKIVNAGRRKKMVAVNARILNTESPKKSG